MSETRFNPAEHMRKVSGVEYLEVKWRLVWFRHENPYGHIATQLIEHEPGKYALFKAEVRGGDPADVALAPTATGYGSETSGDFRDYLEKAETKAVGRALAMLGYGTQFAPELDEGPRIVDSPVERAPAQPRPQPRPQPQAPPQAGPGALSDKQRAFLWGLAGEKGQDEEAVHAFTRQHWGVSSVNDLTKQQASAVIEWLQGLGNASAPRPPRQEPQRGNASGQWSAEPPPWLDAAPEPVGIAGDDPYTNR